MKGRARQTRTDIWAGREGNKLVNFDGSENLVGKLVSIEIIEAKTFFLNGKIIE